MKLDKFEAVLFDKDGTIFDSEKVCCDAWIDTAKVFGVEFTLETYKTFVGVPSDECYAIAHKQFGADFPMHDFIQAVRLDLSIKKKKHLPVKKGFDRFFRFLLSHNIPVGVVTSSNMQSSIESFQSTDYRQHLNVLVTFDDVNSPKPAPDCYILACEKLKVKPQRTLVFEDSSAGVTAAIAAGCHTAFIPDLVDIEPALAQKCDYRFSSFEQAYSVFE